VSLIVLTYAGSDGMVAAGSTRSFSGYALCATAIALAGAGLLRAMAMLA
jgi:hypothetical protein